MPSLKRTMLKFYCPAECLVGSPGGSAVKNHLPTRRRGFHSWVRKPPLEKEIATDSSILPWEILWTEEPGGLQSTGAQRAAGDLATKSTMVSAT